MVGLIKFVLPDTLLVQVQVATHVDELGHGHDHVVLRKFSLNASLRTFFLTFSLNDARCALIIPTILSVVCPCPNEE